MAIQWKFLRGGPETKYLFFHLFTFCEELNYATQILSFMQTQETSLGKIMWDYLTRADATAQVQDNNLVCVEWLSYPVRKFTRLLEAKSGCPEIWESPAKHCLHDRKSSATWNNLRPFYYLLPFLRGTMSCWNGIIRFMVIVSLSCLSWEHLRKLFAICSIKAVPIVAALLLDSWNLKARTPPPPHHLGRSKHTILCSCTCAAASALCQII